MKTACLHRSRFGQLTELIISQTFCFQPLISMFSLLPFPYKLINLINSETPVRSSTCQFFNIDSGMSLYQIAIL